MRHTTSASGAPVGRSPTPIRQIPLAGLLLAAAACAGGIPGDAEFANSNSGKLTVAGELVISSPLVLDKLTVRAGDILNGTVTYQNTSASPIVVQTIGIAARPPGGTNAGGPYTNLTPSLPAQTIPPGATVTLAASRAFTSADPLGAWYSYTTYQDAAGAWHDSPNINFSVVDPSTAAGGLVISSPLVLDKLTVRAGDILNGTVTYQNTSASPIAVQTIGIAARPPGGTNAGGPYTNLTPSLPAQTIPPGATVTLVASRAFTSADTLGAWYSYSTYQDAAGAWHDSPNINFSVVDPPVATITSSPTNPTTQTTASFSFTSSAAGSTFSGQLDSGAAAACTSPQSYSGLAAGSHTFAVTATDPAGNVSAPASYTWTIAAAGGLVISSPLVLDKLTVRAGDILNGTVTYQNTSASAITVQAIAITSRPPGGTHAGGPFDGLTPSLGSTTIQPGATLTLAASRAFTSADPLGAWYAYATYQDSAAAWQDGPNVNFTVAQPAPVITVSVSPSIASLATAGTITFQATVSGTSTGQSTAVTWSVSSGGGAIGAATGLYVAPAVAGSYTVTATSVADPTKTGTASVGVSVPGSGIPAARRTTWSPGIPGGIPSRTTICATVNASTYGNGTTDATSAIQAAIDGCPEGQVVVLPAGSYRTTSNLNIAKGIVLRGAGPALSKIKASLAPGSVAAIYIANLWPTYGSAVNVTADVPKDATSIPVADGSVFAAGDIIQIDQLDDSSYLFYGGCPWFKRPDYGPASSGPRSQGQTVEVVSTSGNTLNIGTPIHLGFKLAFSPQVFKPNGPATPSGNTVKYAGLEDLYVTGGQQNQIDMLNCAYCWVKNIESDGTVSAPSSDGTAGPGNGMSGAHMQIDRSFRVVIRDSYFHHATHVVQGGGAYGISISDHTSDSLIENNIVYYMNKPLTMRATGGGNVIAYNYIDDAWTSADAFMTETDIDMGHSSFPYMELVEGNYAPQIATDDVWGGSGWMTVFRNYASGKQRRTDLHERERIAAIDFAGGAVFMNVVANALGIAGTMGTFNLPQIYEVHSNPPGDLPTVWRLGSSPISQSGNGYHNQDAYDAFPWAAGTTGATLLRQGNFDFITNTIADGAVSGLPLSYYLSAAPSWWGSNPWPYVDPTRTPVVGTLPAKARFDALGVPLQ